MTGFGAKALSNAGETGGTAFMNFAAQRSEISGIVTLNQRLLRGHFEDLSLVHILSAAFKHTVDGRSIKPLYFGCGGFEIAVPPGTGLPSAPAQEQGRVKQGCMPSI
jgi:hypothetical protein